LISTNEIQLAVCLIMKCISFGCVSGVLLYHVSSSFVIAVSHYARCLWIVLHYFITLTPAHNVTKKIMLKN